MSELCLLQHKKMREPAFGNGFYGAYAAFAFAVLYLAYHGNAYHSLFCQFLLCHLAVFPVYLYRIPAICYVSYCLVRKSCEHIWLFLIS